MVAYTKLLVFMVLYTIFPREGGDLLRHPGEQGTTLYFVECTVPWLL